MTKPRNARDNLVGWARFRGIQADDALDGDNRVKMPIFKLGPGKLLVKHTNNVSILIVRWNPWEIYAFFEHTAPSPSRHQVSAKIFHNTNSK